MPNLSTHKTFLKNWQMADGNPNIPPVDMEDLQKRLGLKDDEVYTKEFLEEMGVKSKKELM